MRVEIVANVLSEVDPSTGQLVRATKGDQLTVPEPFGHHLCDRGWARDLEGKYKSAPFTPGAAKLAPAKVAVKPGKGK